ncbi:urea transporter [Kaarinaea lacus]
MDARTLLTIPKAYAAILFLNNPLAGIVILATTFFFPNIGLSGLLAAFVAFIITRLWQFPDYAGHLQIFNSLLVGLSIGAFYTINIYIVGIIIAGAIVTVFVATVLGDAMWRLERLPALSTPFVISAGAMALVARHYTDSADYMGLAEASYTLIHPVADSFFSALGAIFFTPTPLIGAILFIIICIYSRYLGLLAIIGYAFGYLILTHFLFQPHPSFIVWTSFNFMLIAIALGGIFTIPGIISFVFALVGVLMTALLVIASQNLLLVEGLPVMALAFVITAPIMLIAMKKRIGFTKPYLAPEPGLPEVNYEKARLAKFRYGDINSVPLLAPVFGTWTIYQGNNGKYTHKPPWQYALDFYITEAEQSFTNDGTKLEDYYCFGAPVLSPVHGDVARTYDRLQDNKPGEVDNVNNWGNFIIIRLAGGLYVLLAHLQQGSIKVKEGQHVTPGTLLAACGNTGRSPQPHLHLQVQQTAELGSATFPFHLCSVVHHNDDRTLEYRVVSVPKEGDRIEPARPDDQLANQFHLPVGHRLSYVLVNEQTSAEIKRHLTVELTLLGQFRLVSDTSASSAFEENNGVLAFYDRKGPKDLLLDMWVLANGLTPLTEIAHQWRDSPSANLLPLNISQKFVLGIVRPLGCGLDSQYTRHWNEQDNVWIQTGEHTLHAGPIRTSAKTEAVVDPNFGCRQISLEFAGKVWRATLTETGLIADHGIPDWHQNINSNQ